MNSYIVFSLLVLVFELENNDCISYTENITSNSNIMVPSTSIYSRIAEQLEPFRDERGRSDCTTKFQCTKNTCC